MNVDAIKAEAEMTKKAMLKNDRKKIAKLEMSVKGLIGFCDKVLFLCEEVERLKNEHVD